MVQWLQNSHGLDDSAEYDEPDDQQQKKEPTSRESHFDGCVEIDGKKIYRV